MAEKSAPVSLSYGTSAWDEYIAAQKAAKEVLEDRGRLFDPTMLAMAQGFLAPTKTGGFGESLGNVAAAVGPAQQAEEKRIMEMAKMRMEMAQQGLQTEAQTQAAKEEQEYWNRKRGVQPTAPAAAPAAQQPALQQPAPAGALPTAAGAPSAPPAPAAPTAAPAPAAPLSAPMAQAPQPTRAPAAQEPAGVQLFPAMPETWSPLEEQIARSMKVAGKKPFEIEEAIDKRRRENMVVKENQATDIQTGKIYAPPDPTPTEVRIPGLGSYTTTKTLASRLAGAQAANNPEEYWQVADLISKGMQRPTPKPLPGTPTGAAPANAPTQGGMPTTSESEAQAARTKELAVGEAKTENKRRETLPQDLRRADSLVRSADSLYKLVDENPRGFGTFDKPGILPAIGLLVRDGIRNNKVTVDMGGFEDASRAMNPKIKDTDINAVRLAAAEQANIELAYAQMFLAGTGPITEGERLIAKRAGTGSVSQSPDVLKIRAKAVGKRAEFERNDLEAYRQFIEKNPSGTYMNYMGTPQYKSLLNTYDKEMRALSGVTSVKKQSGKPDTSAARAQLDKELEQ
mgnify:CR=1 FL=1